MEGVKWLHPLIYIFCAGLWGWADSQTMPNQLGLKATPGSSQVLLEWDAYPPAALDSELRPIGYQIEWRKIPNPFWVAFGVVSSSDYEAVVFGLKNGERYQFRVAPVFLEGPGPFSYSSRFVVPLTLSELSLFCHSSDEGWQDEIKQPNKNLSPAKAPSDKNLLGPITKTEPVPLDAEKGEEDKVFVASPLNWGIEFLYSSIEFEKYEWSQGSTAAHSAKVLQLHLEKVFTFSKAGKLGIGFLGLGGGGAPNVQISDEVFASLLVVPLQFSLSYRGDFSPSQWVVPSVRLGYEWILSTQLSASGGERPGWRRFQSLAFGLGTDFALDQIWGTAFSKKVDLLLGVNRIFLGLEYGQSKALSENQIADLSHQELRLRFRLEW